MGTAHRWVVTAGCCVIRRDVTLYHTSRASLRPCTAWYYGVLPVVVILRNLRNLQRYPAIYSTRATILNPISISTLRTAAPYAIYIVAVTICVSI
eukprot:209810-Amorphochlora_amoeboformis.AAC.1